MLYSKYIKEVFDLAIIEDLDSSGYWYIDPHYVVKLIDAELTPDKVTDYTVDWAQIARALDLETDKRNKLHDRSRFVMDWLFEIIASTVDPVMVSEENELMKNMMEYMKLNSELKSKEQALQDREADLDYKEEVQETRSNVLQQIPGMNFSKRGAQ